MDYYGEDRFPIEQTSTKLEGNKFTATFKVTNLTNSFISSSAHAGLVDEPIKPKIEDKPNRFSSTGDILIGETGSLEVTIDIPKNYLSEWITVDFTLKTANEFIYGVSKRVRLNI